jgi:hypothetical protein
VGIYDYLQDGCRKTKESVSETLRKSKVNAIKRRKKKENEE